MILVIDNFDSFTYNIVSFYKDLGYEVIVKRNTEITLEEIEALKNCSHILLSPGPKAPKDAPLIMDVIERFKGRKKIFGVCLGLQAIGEYFGGRIVHAKSVCHGKVSRIEHSKKGVFASLNSPIFQTRYHSLVVEKETLPDELEITALSDDGDIMGLRSKNYDIEGVQFHPESILSSNGGREILEAFVKDPKPSFDASYLLRKITMKEDLDESESSSLMKSLGEGLVPDAMIGAILTGLNMKGFSSSELAGFAKTLLVKASPFSAPKGAIDIVGTGGDGSASFNISTASMILSAACGARVAKHGNGAFSSQAGSADVLKALGVNIEATREVMEKSLEDNNVAFLFAPLYHPSMKAVSLARRQLKVSSIFNLMGPLVNPSKLKRALIGLSDVKLMPLVSDVLMNLAYEKALLVHSYDGLDEISIFDKTDVIEIAGGEKKTYTLQPKDFGFCYDSSQRAEITGGDAKQNALILTEIFSGKTEGAKKDIVVFNAGAALYVASKVSSIEEGVVLAKKTLESGKVLETLERFKEASHEHS